MTLGMDWGQLSIVHCNSVKIEDDDELEDGENTDMYRYLFFQYGRFEAASNY